MIDAAPADVERAIPFVAAIGNHAATAADTGVVEQQVDLIGLVTVANLVAKPLDLCPVGNIGDVRRDTQPSRQSRHLTEPCVSDRPVGETSHTATLQASATS